MQPPSSFETKFKFPTKASMMPIAKGNRMPIRSNHFREMKTKEEATFTEWFLSFIKKSDLNQWLADQTFRADAVSPDSRYLIDQIYRRNRVAIDKKIGRSFLTGVTLYSSANLSANINRTHFTEHAEFVLIIEKKNVLSTVKQIQNGANRQELTRFLNTTLKNQLALQGYLEIGKNKKYYNPKLTERVEAGDFAYQVYIGYKTAYDVYEDGLRLLVDYSTRIIHESSVWQDVGYYRSQKGLSDAEIIENYIVGHSVWTSYGSQKSYKIDKVLTDKSIDSPFPNPEYKSYREYFLKRYKINLKDPKQWLLVHIQTIRDRDPSGKVIGERQCEHVFPSEIVRATGIPEEERANFQVMKAFAALTCIPPDQRFAKYQTLINMINESSGKEQNGIKIDPTQTKIDSKANQIEGCFLPKPKILNKPNNGFVPPKDRIDVKSLYKGVPLTNWAVVYDKFSDRNLDPIIDNLMSSCGRFNIEVTEPQVYLMPPSGNPADLETHMKKGKNYKRPDIILFVIGKRGANKIYKNMKSYFTAQGIPLQFFVSFNPKRDMQANSKYSNIVLQMVNKLGSNLWVIDRSQEGSLIVGAMTTNSSRGRSIITMASQFGPNFSRNFASTKIVASQAKADVGRTMGECLMEQIEFYKQSCKKLPQNVIFYRQGTSEQQLEVILNEEVQKIVDSLASKFGPQAPKLVAIVVTKRIDDRFAEEAGGRIANPSCGLIVDNNVVKDGYANFYMVAQFVNQGSANPTHYAIIFNNTAGPDAKKEPGLSLSIIQTLTYELCWSYTNWMGPIKVPAPLQLANKLAALMAITMSDAVKDQLKSLLYYL